MKVIYFCDNTLLYCETVGVNLKKSDFLEHTCTFLAGNTVSAGYLSKKIETYLKQPCRH